ncbi:MAG: hypothetical protein U0T32_10780 [Chitinophagales bacterium]
MKKLIFLSALIITLFSSCKKCVDCTYKTQQWNSITQQYETVDKTEHFCKPDYYDNKAWEQSLEYYKNNGGSCK